MGDRLGIQVAVDILLVRNVGWTAVDRVGRTAEKFGRSVTGRF